MEKKTACTDLPLSSSKTIDDYHQCEDKEQFIQEVLRDQQSLREELHQILKDVDRYKRRTGQLIDGLISDNVELRQKLARFTERRIK
jgi:K+/H+ antiporter YhaU regulatory subunit KhtT